MKKLQQSIPSNSRKIIDIYNKIDSEVLNTSPDFQRKLVWKKQHKYSFIETILMNFPFPEVYIASSEIDVEKLKSKEIVVDGQQRLTTIVEYIKGINDFENQNKIKSFEKLTIEEKRDFLNYPVSVKDLKDMDIEYIKEIFQRINNTEYALNTNERNNAQYGDGEFAVFCKQVVDKTFNPTGNETDVILNQNDKSELNNFFEKNNIFNENDKSRMFDVQYIMLIISTFLEGDYYARSTKVNEYLEKYNGDFENYHDCLSMLINSVRVISSLELAKLSYWYNKANLFTLIIELSKIDSSKLDLQKLEIELLDLEAKGDFYFSDDDLSPIQISDDEKKYFEVARQGSHEKAARIHRGKVISELLKNCLKNTAATNNILPEESRIKILERNNILFTTIEPTKTGLEKSIMDATLSVREFLRENSIHNYDVQSHGPEHKVKKQAKYISETKESNLEISLYKANHRGDARIWFSGLKSNANPNDILAIIYKNENIYILNITQLAIENLIGSTNPFNDIILNK